MMQCTDPDCKCVCHKKTVQAHAIVLPSVKNSEPPTSRQESKTLNKTAQPRRRRNLAPPPQPNDPMMVSFLNIFGLSCWDDNKAQWTLNDITKEGIENYSKNIRPYLLNLDFPLNYIKKLKVANPTQKEMVTLLNQFARIYGYKVVHKCRMVRKEDGSGYTSYQIYNLETTETVDLPSENETVDSHDE